MQKNSAFFYGYVIVICSFFILIVTFGTLYSFGVFFNRLRDDLGWTAAVTSTGYSMSQIFGGITGIITGRLSDKFGPRLIVLACGIILALGCFLMSQVNHVWQLYIYFGAFVGIGVGGSSIALASTTARWFKKRRGLMNGIAVAGIGTGTVIMPPLANYLLTLYDWRLSFVIVGLMALVVVTPSALFLKRDPSKMGLLPDGVRGTASTEKVLPESGMSFRESIRTRQFLVICIIYVCFGFYVQSIMVHIVPHAESLGYATQSAAIVMSFLGVGSITGRIVLGSISDRIGVKYTLIIALCLIVSSFLWLINTDSLWGLYLFSVIYGVGYGGMISMQALAPASLFGLLSLGALVGVITFIYTFGGFTGPILTGYIFDTTGSYMLSFIIFAAISAVALILALTLRSPGRKGN